MLGAGWAHSHNLASILRQAVRDPSGLGECEERVRTGHRSEFGTAVVTETDELLTRDLME